MSAGLDGEHRPWFQKLWIWWLIGVAVSLSCCATLVFDVPGWLRGDTDIFGDYSDEVELADRRENLTPMERLHAELFPRWAIAQANPNYDETERWKEFIAAVEDEELRNVANELRELLRSPELVARGVEIQRLLERWNARLEAIGAPYYVTGSVSPVSKGVAGVFEFYAVLARPTATAGGEDFPAIVLQRIDRTNVREPYFGRTDPDSDRAIIVVDRVVDFALDSVWLPLAHEQHEDPVNAAFWPRVRSELEAALGEDRYRVLAEAATHRKVLFDSMDSSRSRNSCGNRMQWTAEVPFDGFSPRTLDRLEAYAEADKIQPCPRIRFEEADAIREATEALRGNPELEPAIEALIALLARSTVTHEVRHLADDRRYDGLRAPLPCEPCDERTSLRVRAELSAYTTSLASAEYPALALYQDCVSVRGGGSHRRALALLAAQMEIRCDEAPPDDLRDRARAADRHFFGRDEPVLLPTSYPERLPVHWW